MNLKKIFRGIGIIGISVLGGFSIFNINFNFGETPSFSFTTTSSITTSSKPTATTSSKPTATTSSKPTATTSSKPTATTSSTTNSSTTDDNIQEIKSGINKGNITFSDQIDRYTYTAPVTGKYRFDFDRDSVNVNYRFLMWNSKDKNIADTYASSKGKTIDLTAGETYRIQIEQHIGFASYTISINVPNESYHIIDNAIVGNITFVDQIDRYTYTAPVTGEYRFDFDRDSVNANYRFLMWNSKDKNIADTYASSKGKTIDLTAGETYRIQIEQHIGFVEYAIIINYIE